MATMTDRHETALGGPRGSFLTTRWTLLRDRDLESVARLYWRPVYLHVRRLGFDVEEAKDLTQDFFARFIEKDWAAQADRARGRFRSFLRAAIDHFCADARDRARAGKRGGGRVVSLDAGKAEPLLSTDVSPERQFDRQWARSILEDALAELEAEYAARGQSEKFSLLKPVLAGGTSDDRVALHRARRRFGELVRQRVALTVESPGALEDELSALLESL
jgi:RNA polymerase sigma-70 factor (ECF subfamily)